MNIDSKQTIINEHFLNTILQNAHSIYIYGQNKHLKILLDFFTQKQSIVKLKAILLCKDEQSSHLYGIKVKSPNTVLFNKRDVVFVLPFLTKTEFTTLISTLAPLGVHEQQIIPSEYYLPLLINECCGFISTATELSNYQLPKLASIDIVDACNLSCVTCPRTNYPGTSTKMDINLFNRILDKLTVLNFNRIELYNWTEPFLHPNILEFIKSVKQKHFACGISSNFSKKEIPNLLACVDLLNGSQDLLVVTISGLTQDLYTINHQHGNINNVLHNLKIAAQSKNKQKIVLRLLLFDYNRSECKKVINLANSLGINYEIRPAKGDPLTIYGKMNSSTSFKNNFFQPPLVSQQYNRIFDNFAYCVYNSTNSITINANGNVHLCCNADPITEYDVGSFLTQDFFIVQLKRLLHPLCQNCINFVKIDEPSVALHNTILQGMQNLLQQSSLASAVTAPPNSSCSKLKTHANYFIANNLS